MISLLNSKNTVDNAFKIYTKPYSRVGSYLPGLLCGFIFSQYKSTKFIDGTAKMIVGIITLNKKIAYSVFFFGYILINVVMWVPYPCFQDTDNDYMYYSYAGNVTFIGFENVLTGLGFTCLLLPVLFGMIPFVYTILSWKGWLPIAKASFSIYLTHFLVMVGFMSAEQYGFTMSQVNFFTDFVFGATMSISLGMLVYITIEAPFGRILKIAFMPKPKVPKEQPLLERELEMKA